jgi:hypothetical protein
LSLALAEAMKPVATATDELHSLDPDKKKAREKVVSDYRKAAAQDGELDVRFKAADAAFIRTAEDMAGLFDAWLDRMTDTAADGAVAIAFRERQQVQERLDATRGDRERRRLRWQAETKLWESRFAAWKNPTANLTALMTDPAKINGLNADINNDKKRDLAMFAFWFEVAPKHLQLRGDPLPKKVAEQVAALQAALAPAPDLALGYDLGPDRDDGSLYLIDPDGLEQKRKEVLDAWTKAATAQAEAEAAFKLRPDDAASLGPRWDKLKDDGWVKAARTLLEAQDA